MGLLDDIGDLRRYLFLVEHHIRYGIQDMTQMQIPLIQPESDWVAPDIPTVSILNETLSQSTLETLRSPILNKP